MKRISFNRALVRLTALNVLVSVLALTAPTMVQAQSDKSIIDSNNSDLGDLAVNYKACAVNSLYLICKLKSIPANMAEINKSLSPEVDGSNSINDLERAAKLSGLEPMSVTTTISGLLNLSFPLIALVRNTDSKPLTRGNSHYIVVLGAFPEGLLVLDAPRAAEFYDYNAFKTHWSGVAVAFNADPLLRKPTDNLSVLLTTHNLILIGLTIYVVILAISIIVKTRRHPFSPNPLQAATLLLTFCCGCGRPDRLSNALLIPNHTINLGVLKPGLHDFSFDIENNGMKPIRVTYIQSSCSCTVPEKPLPLAPGTKTKVRGSVKVANGPGSARLILRGDGFVGDEAVDLFWVGVGPPRLYPSDTTLTMHEGATAECELEILCADGNAAISLQDVSQLPPWLSARITTKLTSNQSTRVRHYLHLTAIRPDTSFRSAGYTLKLTQSNTIYPITLNLTIDFITPIRVTPKQLIIVSNPRLESLSKTYNLIVESSSDKPLQIQKVPNNFSADIVPIPNSPGRFKLTITHKLRLPEQKMITLHISDGAAYSVDVPIRILAGSVNP